MPPAAGTSPANGKSGKGGAGCFKIGCLGVIALLLVIGISIGVTYWLVTRKERFEPVVLTPSEQQVFDQKLSALDLVSEGAEGRVAIPPLEDAPVVDAEPAAVKLEDVIDDRTLILTQRELNSWLHAESERGDEFKVLLVRDGIEVRMSVQMEEDAIIMKGKNIRGKIRMHIAMEGDDFVVQVKKVTVGGIALPKAWLEGLGVSEGTNLIGEFYSPEFAEKFSEGIEEFRIEDGKMILRLAE